MDKQSRSLPVCSHICGIRWGIYIQVFLRSGRAARDLWVTKGVHCMRHEPDAVEELRRLLGRQGFDLTDAELDEIVPETQRSDRAAELLRMSAMATDESAALFRPLPRTERAGAGAELTDDA